MAQKYRVLFGRTLQSDSAGFVPRRAKGQESAAWSRFLLTFDCLQAVAWCLQIMIAQPYGGSAFRRTARTKCAASRALSCGLIKKRTSRLRFERGVGALLPYRVGQSGQGSPLRIRRPHQLRFRAYAGPGVGHGPKCAQRPCSIYQPRGWVDWACRGGRWAPAGTRPPLPLEFSG